MRKRILAAILAAAMAGSLFGCDSASTTEEVVETEETEETDTIEEEPEEDVVEDVVEEAETDPEPAYEEVFYTVEVSTVNEDGTYIAYDATSVYLITLAEDISDETKELFAEGIVLTVTTLVEVTEDVSTDTVDSEESVDTSEPDSSTDTGKTVSFDYDTVIEITVVDAAVVEEAEAFALVQLVFENQNGYTVQDMDETTMYATRSVNVRSVPSADSDKLGTLSKAQEVTVTGLTSTDWYRVSYNGDVAYVSANYLANEKPTTTTTTTTTTTEVAENNTSNSSDNTESSNFSVNSYLDNYEAVYAYLVKEYSWMGNLVYSFEEMANAYMAAWGTAWDSEEWAAYDRMMDANIDNALSSSSTDTTTSTDITTITVATSGYSTECVGYINELRTSVGVATLTWSDSLAEVALARANELAEAGALDGHEGLSKYGSYGENIFWSSVSSASAYDAYTGWYNSEGHYNNMVRSSYTNVAVAYATSGSGSFWVTIFK